MSKNTTDLIRQAAPRGLVLAASAVGALVLGTCVYLLDRDWSTALFLAPFAAFQGEQVNLFGFVGNVLPSFCHAYAFSLLLILALGRTPRARVFGALAWFAVAAGMEILQSLQISTLMSSLAVLHTDSLLPGSIINYAVNGRFDTCDLAAAGLGCVAAGLLASIPEERK